MKELNSLMKKLMVIKLIELMNTLVFQTSLITFFIMDLMLGKLQYKQQKINTQSQESK